MYKYLLSRVGLGIILGCTLSMNLVLAKNKQVYPELFKLAFTHVPTTLDPQKTTLLANYALRSHIFDQLFLMQEGKVVPVLLESYRWKTPTRWEFALKRGILFHDGSELTSQDVVASFRRAYRLKSDLYDVIKDYQVRALDTYRFEVESPKPDSELLWNLENFIIIKHTAERADSEGFNSGKHLIGTGPYRLLERKGFKEFRLEAFPDYHRGAAFIQQLLIQVAPNPQQKMIDFLSGKLDMIAYTMTKGLTTLQQKANITSKASHALYLLVLNTGREVTSDARDWDDKPLTRNPFKDLRVRQAISKALNREQLLFQLLGSKNIKQIAGQLINQSVALHDSTLLPDKQDIGEAKRLLKEAGYPEGFQVTIRDVDTRYHYLEAIAAMLAKIGIKAKIEVLPAGEYFKGVDSQAFGVMFYFGSSGGNLGEMLKGFYTNSKENSGGYSNLLLDHKIDSALSQLSIDLKDRQLREAQRIVINDMSAIPLFFRSDNWAVRPDMIFEPTDQLFTEAYYVRPDRL